jgi:hemolysin activation/secretion protein
VQPPLEFIARSFLLKTQFNQKRNYLYATVHTKLQSNVANDAPPNRIPDLTSALRRLREKAAHKTQKRQGVLEMFSKCRAWRRERPCARQWGGLAAGIVATLLPLVVAAQATGQTPAQVIEEGLRRQQEREAQQQRSQQPQADVLSKPQPRLTLAELPRETTCFVIDDISLDGPGSQRFRWLLNETLPYLQRCIGVQGLQHIASVLDQTLVEQGYATTRVVLPAQNLRDGRLKLFLHVGRVSELRMVRSADGKAVVDYRWGTWRNAFPISEGDTLDIRALEQGVEQMKRLPSQSVSTRIEPGALPDTSIVLIERETSESAGRVRGGFTLDNSGSQALGRTQLSANAALDNPFGLNDLLNLGFNTNAERTTHDHRSQSLSGGYSIPWGYSTFSVNSSRNEFAQIVQGTTAQFLSSGRSESNSVRWQHMALRTASSKTALYAEVSTRRANSYLDDVELIVQKRRTTNLETGLTHRQLIGDAAIDIDIAHRRGMPWHSAQDDLPTSGSGGLTLRPQLWTLNASLTLPLKAAGHELQWSSSVRAQRTHDNTLSVDQIAIGGRGSVRGFDGDRVLLAERGWVLRNELSATLKRFEGFGGIELSAYAALDAGRVWGPSDVNLVGHALVGAAVGLRGRHKNLQFDAALGAPVHTPFGFVTSSVVPYVNATYGF